MRRIWRVAWRLFQWGSVALTLLLLIVYWTPLVPWYAGKLMGPWNDAEGDVLIVLSAEVQQDDVIGPVSYWRTVYAARVLRSGQFRTVVFSGGPGGGSQSMARTMADFVSCYAKPPRILLEERSTSTRENALFTKRLLENEPGRKVLLTSDLHTFRAVRSFRAVGLQVESRPVPDMLKMASFRSQRWTCFIGLGVETAKIVYYWYRGWI
jgi:uncharacterized SAM-binding protein YcdF (DUF218 family)